jgi:imidazolonepropionase-like amidohydrolase
MIKFTLNYFAMKNILFLFFVLPFSFFAQIKPMNGVQNSKPNFIALTHATVYVSPTEVMKDACILLKDELIIDVKKNNSIPKDAYEINCEGKFIFPTFIETNTSVGLSKSNLNSIDKGAYWNPTIHPEFSASNQYSIDENGLQELQKMGFGFAISHLNDGIARGTGVLISTNSSKQRTPIILPTVGQFFSFQKGSSEINYPSSQMGAIALLRQFFLDANWYKSAIEKEYCTSLERYNQLNELPIVFQSNDKFELLRASKIAKEFNLSFNFIGAGNEYELAAQLKSIKSTIVLPLNFPESYDVKDPYVARQIPLSDLKNWEMAPSNPAILAQNGLGICFTSAGIKSPEQFWKNIQLAIKRGLPFETALSALTLQPAKMLKIDQQIGTLEKGKKASFLIYTKNPFVETANLLEKWDLGQQEIMDRQESVKIGGKFNLLIDGQSFPIEISEKEGKYTANLKVSDSVSKPIFIQVVDKDLTLQFTTTLLKTKGSLNLHGKINEKLGVLEGDGTLADGTWVKWSAIRNEKQKSPEDSTKKSLEDSLDFGKIWFPNLAYGFEKMPLNENIIIENATVWTNEKEGILKDATLIIENGKLKFVGSQTAARSYARPLNPRVINAKGMHVTSGIIDEHSHIAIDKGVNEGGQAITAEVNIGEVLQSDDINIYRQLAGGVTAAQLLHGSANPIGGQSALIKLKWGVNHPDELLIPNAPKFIKCALGENVKQSNWGDYNSNRFPQTRMGVEQVFIDGFNRAKQYQKEWNEYLSGKSKSEQPRKDLELDVLVEILNGQRNITCHSYVQSEINMLLYVADSMGFKINTFTHILEGYKLADKLLKHGAGASTFSDWWAYKFEVNDAIPFNATMMSEQGLTVAINSDDAEMGRRLNQEAAKSVKYGGMSEENAWKMVTLNPAKLLHLDDRMGSLKAGKDADIVIWSANPLSIEAKVQTTIIDGIIYYDVKRDQELRERNTRERARILNKLLAEQKESGTTKPFVKKKSKHFHCDTLGEEGSESENSH